MPIPPISRSVPTPGTNAAATTRVDSALPNAIEAIAHDDAGANIKEAMRNLLEKGVATQAPAEGAKLLAALANVEMLAQHAHTEPERNALVKTANAALRALTDFAHALDRSSTDWNNAPTRSRDTRRSE